MLYSAVYFDKIKKHKHSIFHQFDMEAENINLVSEKIKQFDDYASTCFIVPNPRCLNLVDKKRAVIYFFKLHNFVKIGYTTDLITRFNNIQLANPYNLEVSYIIPLSFGGIADYRHYEQVIHERLYNYRVNREWFDCACLSDSWLKKILTYDGGYSLNDI